MNSSPNLADPVMSFLAASGGDTVKLFDVSANAPGDPCILTYTPSPGCLVNAVRWNHTNLVVASAGDDKKISLWRKSGQCIGTLPTGIADSVDSADESISVINFSNKGSRYLCSGGSGQTIRIWDLQRKRCIKWLKGHTSPITGAVYNCKDEHLASVSVSGDLILHNLTAGSKVAELKDPNHQVLRVLDYSRMSRHLLLTSGDDGSIHLYDTTTRNPKMSWVKQHSAPTSGVSFSPSNDKIIASVGLDKKLCIYDIGARRPSCVVTYETPFSSMAFRDDGLILACGTVGGKVVFYDVRGKPQPMKVIKSYGSSEAVNSLCWQRGKPFFMKENCGNDMALLGGSVDDAVVMPDPLPSSGRNSGASVLQVGLVDETPSRNLVRPSGHLAKLNPGRTQFNLLDDMGVFSPVVDVQPITPSIWDDKKAPTLQNSKRFTFADMPTVGIDRNQDDLRPNAAAKIGDPTQTDDKFSNLIQSFAYPTRVGITQKPSSPFGTKDGTSDAPSTVPRRTYAERIGAVSASAAVSTESSSVGFGSPKVKKSGSENKDEISNSAFLRPQVAGAVNGVGAMMSKTVSSEGPGNSFTLQLFQRTLEEKLESFQKFVHEDMRNLHIDVLRQFHLQEMQFSATTKMILDQQAELVEQIKALRMENSQLRQML